VDRDHWSEEHLDQLAHWAKERANQNLALSNPKFEYWLLLHFEDGHQVKSVEDITIRFKRHLPSYEKDIDASWFPDELKKQAVLRARKRDTPPCDDWPRKAGSTKVYRLVDKLL